MACQNYTYGCVSTSYPSCYARGCGTIPFPSNCVQVCQPVCGSPCVTSCPSPCPTPIPCPVTIVEYLTTAPTATTIPSGPVGFPPTPIPVGSTTIPEGTVTTIIGYATTPIRSIGGITLNVATGQFTVPLAGTYLITGFVGFSANTIGTREVYIYKVNGATSVITLVSLDNKNAVSIGPTYTSFSAQEYLNAGDRIFFAATQNSGSVITTIADNRFSISRLNRQ
ncbi:hypothetical protein QLL95_gp1254 [Cotonvirus japonicus]|uniref:C1q domain-containing protein n=1 Tax=Cotonvirus japonicus TaxID=2811091 RepID=A0ABM7NRU6_9VIRU|nr:hypothetical protein QLL95_gp1254 [Cotonvirus japonicus]BCS82869.1 hypothetical protein [Cotonvirus japonicus]